MVRNKESIATGMIKKEWEESYRSEQPQLSHDRFAASKSFPVLETYAGFETNFFVLPSAITVAEARATLEAHREEFVVFKLVRPAEVWYYLNLRKEIAITLQDKEPEQLLEMALGLSGDNKTPIITTAVMKQKLQAGELLELLWPKVVLERDEVVAVLRRLGAGMPSGAGSLSKPHHNETVVTREEKARRRGTADSAEETFTKAEPALDGFSPTGFGTVETGTPGPDDAVEVLCHFSAQMQGEMVLKAEQQVQVTISREELELAMDAGLGKDTAEEKVATSKKLTVRLVPKKNFQVVGANRIEIEVPKPDSPLIMFFDVKPTKLGDGEIWISICEGPVALVILKLKSDIVAELSGLNPPDAQAQQSAAPEGQNARINTMRVYVQESGDKKRYCYDLWLDKVDDTYESAEFNSADLANLLEPYLSLFGNVDTNNQLDFKQLQMQLRSIGAKLFQTLFPQELQQVFWDNRNKIDHLKLYCEEPFIPWEVLHICEPGKPLPQRKTYFLGQMGLVRWLHGHSAPTELKVRDGRAYYATPSYPGDELDNAKKEGEMLKTLFNASPVAPATRPELTKLLTKEGPFDLFHFAGHGEASEEQISDSRIILESAGSHAETLLKDLTPELITGYCQLKGEDGSQPIVVLNTCCAGKTGYYITGISGFASAFLEREAGVFVGALWEIGDEPAYVFIETFYKALLNGDKIADAVTKGRKEAYKKGDATYLSYVVYADPFAHLVIEK